MATLDYRDADARRGLVSELSGAEKGSPYWHWARVIECWYRRHGGGKARLRRRLLSEEDQEFWAAWWELAAARLLDKFLYQVELEPNIQGKTPDIRARGAQAMAVEVLHVNPSAATREEERWIARLEERLRESVTLPHDSFLSFRLHGPATGTIPGPVLDRLAASLQRWLDAGHEDSFDFQQGTLGLSGTWMPHTGRDIAIGYARAIGDVKRFQDRVGTKIGRYKELADLDLPIVLVIGVSHWTLPLQGMIDALFGVEQVQIRLDKQGVPVGVATSRFSGEGVLVPGGQSGHSAAEAIAGVLWGQIGGFDAEAQAFGVDIMFVHNPYSDRSLEADTFAPLPEYQRSGDVMTWVRGDHPIRLWLDCPEEPSGVEPLRAT